jgi:uncharacterized membrane protein YoaK (UPF0700 family)
MYNSAYMSELEPQQNKIITSATITGLVVGALAGGYLGYVYESQQVLLTVGVGGAIALGGAAHLVSRALTKKSINK